MSLQDWLKNGWLTEHESSAREIGDLMSAVERDLADGRTRGLSADWRFNIAYNAALQAATAALAASGFRAGRDQHHFRVLQSLALTIGVESRLIQLLDNYRKKRNIGTYERAGIISDHEADQMLQLAEDIRKRVTTWLQGNHPELWGK
jgi:hypothetical protein